MPEQDIAELLGRIADSLERLAPVSATRADLDAADAFVWHAEQEYLEPVTNVNRLDLDLLQGIDQQRETLYENTMRFAEGLPANNALLWGCLLYTSPSPRDRG